MKLLQMRKIKEKIRVNEQIAHYNFFGKKPKNWKKKDIVQCTYRIPTCLLTND